METHITFVLDSSGSMSAIEDDTIGGFNSFLDDQRDEEGTATVSLFDFNTNIDRVYQGQPIAEAQELTSESYTPGGRTALHDAISMAIDDTMNYITSFDPTERPETVVVVILTDGKENASEIPQEMVRARVEKCREDFDWEFLFIGANQDAALTASKMGMDQDKSLDMAHNAEGTRAAYESTSERISEARREGSTSGFDEDDRDRQNDADDT